MSKVLWSPGLMRSYVQAKKVDLWEKVGKMGAIAGKSIYERYAKKENKWGAVLVSHWFISSYWSPS